MKINMQMISQSQLEASGVNITKKAVRLGGGTVPVALPLLGGSF